MKFITHNDEQVNANGTHLQGYVDANYAQLLGKLGKPHDGDGYKTDWEWNIEFEDGTVATIYNWKNGPNYGGDFLEITPDMIREWHVGGFNSEALENVKRILLTA